MVLVAIPPQLSQSELESGEGRPIPRDTRAMVQGPDFYPNPVARAAWSVLAALLWIAIAAWRIFTLPIHILANAVSSKEQGGHPRPVAVITDAESLFASRGQRGSVPQTVTARFDGGYTANVLLVGPPAAAAVVLLPGNPGCVTFYQEYLADIHARLGGAAQCVAIGHASHGRTCRDGNCHNLESQIHHHCGAVDLYLRQHPDVSQVILVGHSIGAHLCLEVAKRLPQGHGRVVGIFALFPTIHHIGKN